MCRSSSVLFAHCAGAYHSLQRLGQSCELVVVTSRQHCIQQPTLDWIEQHFPGVFSEVHFGNHWALEGKSKAKSEICRCVKFGSQLPGVLIAMAGDL
jgi:TFIIF-interacting CTD phosphatase-like protein